MVTNCRVHLHTPTVKWINVSRELCHFIYQQNSPYRPCLAATEVGGQGTSAWFWVLSNTESYHPGDSREGSKPLLLPPQTQGMPRDVCQGVPKQPSGDCISLAGLTHTSPRKEYGRWFYRPVASELKMSPGALCRMGVLVTLGCGNISFLSVDMQLQVGQSRAEGSSPAVCQLVFVFFTLMGLEFPSNTLCCRA